MWAVCFVGGMVAGGLIAILVMAVIISGSRAEWEKRER